MTQTPSWSECVGGGLLVADLTHNDFHGSFLPPLQKRVDLPTIGIVWVTPCIANAKLQSRAIVATVLLLSLSKEIVLTFFSAASTL